jgi:hypothetical protein
MDFALETMSSSAACNHSHDAESGKLFSVQRCKTKTVNLFQDYEVGPRHWRKFKCSLLGRCARQLEKVASWLIGRHNNSHARLFCMPSSYHIQSSDFVDTSNVHDKCLSVNAIDAIRVDSRSEWVGSSRFCLLLSYSLTRRAQTVVESLAGDVILLVDGNSALDPARGPVGLSRIASGWYVYWTLTRWSKLSPWSNSWMRTLNWSSSIIAFTQFWIIHKWDGEFL